MDYPVAEAALAKWVRERLVRFDPATRADGRANSGRGLENFVFRYTGSTCSNGGSAFEAHMYVCVDAAPPSDGGSCVVDAWIEFPPHTIESAARMCAARNGLFARLSEPAPFCGRPLEDVVQEKAPMNYAGCFCTQPMINEKWKQALSTVHYALTNGG